MAARAHRAGEWVSGRSALVRKCCAACSRGVSEHFRCVGIIGKRGVSRKEIASQLYISVQTIETHRANLMSKLGVRLSPEDRELSMMK